MSAEALQTAEERREVKNKVERERYTQLNAEFQRTARKNKKGFLNEQCKETEENSRMGKMGDLSSRAQRSQGNISSKDGHDKGQKQ